MDVVRVVVYYYYDDDEARSRVITNSGHLFSIFLNDYIRLDCFFLLF